MSIAAMAGLVIFLVLVVLFGVGSAYRCFLVPRVHCRGDAVAGIFGGGTGFCREAFPGHQHLHPVGDPVLHTGGKHYEQGRHSGAADRLRHRADGQNPRLLAHTNIVANMLFGAISGSGTAAASAMGSIIGPVQKRPATTKNFPPQSISPPPPPVSLFRRAPGLSPMPSPAAGTSVAALFLGGYIPGILWGLKTCMAVAYFYAKKRATQSGQRASHSTDS